MRRIHSGPAAALVHQSCPVPIGDFDKVAGTCVHWCLATSPNIKAGELQPQRHPACHFYDFCDVNIVRVEFIWPVWRADISCGKKFLTLKSKASQLTLDAAAFCRAKRVCWLP